MSAANGAVEEEVIRGLRRNKLKDTAVFLKRFAQRQPLGTLGALIIIGMVIVGIFAPWIAPRDPYETSIYTQYAPLGTSGMLLGGDHMGRDVLSRLIYGARISLYVGLISTLIGVSLGTALGITTATLGGKVDLFIQRFVDALMAFPGLILALAIMAVMGSSLNNVILAITIGFIPATSRALRSQALSIASMDYITAAKALGVSQLRVIFRHVLPNCMSLSFVLASVTLGAAIIIESSLSFLGLGSPPEEPSWGGMISGQTYLFLRKAPYLVYLPSIAIGMAVFGFNMLGDALRDLWDPRMRGGAGRV